MNQELAIRNRFDLPTEVQALEKFRAIRAFQALVHRELTPGVDYGVIPGTDKPTLLKPGAEKIAKLLDLEDWYEVERAIEDWDKPLFSYRTRCHLTVIGTERKVGVSEGVGECNSMEARFRWREAKRKCPACGTEAIIKGKQEWGGGWVCHKKQGGCGVKFKDGDQTIESQKVGRVLNDDIYSQVNSILKQSKKRSLVDASLSAGRLSNLFTQDMEDLAPQADVESTAREVPEQPPSKAAAPAAPKPTPTTPATPPVKDEQSVRAEAISAARGWDSKRFLKEFEVRASTTWRGASPLTKAAVMDTIERDVPVAAEEQK